ncbi:integrase core domain-containing protein [Gilliamella intestini]|uniref:integrase core domain-containing protein n=1 Tax=Gilliamella intestini TaxID=1798183 RepID=UPI000AC6AD98
MWHNQPIFNDLKDRKQKLKHFINFYNTVKPHKAISGEWNGNTFSNKKIKG